MLHGGGPEDDVLYGRFVAGTGNGDIVTLGSNDPADTYLDFFDGYFTGLGAASAVTFNTQTRAEADDPALIAAIDQAEGLYFRGGDQGTYLDLWYGTELHAALNRAVARGAVFGGSSAGMAILGERIYDAQVGSIDAWQALLDPYDPTLTFTDGFLPDLLPGVLTDTHFTERGRLGRLAVFVARWQDDGRSDGLGVGVDPETALYVYDDGHAEVAGIGAVTLLHPAAALTLEPGAPVDLRGMKLWQLPAGYSVDLRAPDPVLSRPAYVAVQSAAGAIAGWKAGPIDGSSAAQRQLGHWYAPNMDDLGYPWYYGELTEAAGQSVLPGTAVVTRLYDDSDLFENHIGGMMWLLARHPGLVGIGVDLDVTVANTADEAILTDAKSYALIVDPRTATAFGDPGGAPQTVAIEGATLDIAGNGNAWQANP